MSIRFSPGDEVTAVEHDDATRQPREDGEILHGTVIAASDTYARVRFSDGRDGSFWQESGWTAWDGEFRWRIEPEDECDGADRGAAR